ncbi:ricin B lectin domain-containing protein [Cristinia sonorae]|uniref:Ricin B lectin domain-containing protein n=1 Tax=Cristinia sonorae TaxID=1940300 RepID=A0A8K0XTT0_9AGAR|nr:ricin B lectin domain-containing protein [Cristinia sonorae]
MALKTGASYVIVNKLTGFVVDLSAGDNKSVILFDLNGDSNQQWVAKKVGSFWTFQSKATGSYLGVAGEPVAQSLVVASKDAVRWTVEPDPTCAEFSRIIHGSTNFSLDIQEKDEAVPGTKVILGEYVAEGQQSWRFEEFPLNTEFQFFRSLVVDISFISCRRSNIVKNPTWVTLTGLFA